jgi:hypothetical protein
MEAISGRKTLQKIAADHALQPMQLSQRKKQLGITEKAKLTAAQLV